MSTIEKLEAQISQSKEHNEDIRKPTIVLEEKDTRHASMIEKLDRQLAECKSHHESLEKEPTDANLRMSSPQGRLRIMQAQLETRDSRLELPNTKLGTKVLERK